jgi:hypothetical protein
VKGRQEIYTGFGGGNLKGRDYFEDLMIDVREQTGLMWVKACISGRLLGTW